MGGRRDHQLLVLAQRLPAVPLGRALLLIGEGWTDDGRTRWLDARRVLAEAWNLGRLKTARARLAAGDNPPAIRVVGFHFVPGGAALYQPSDGIHRTVAAREAGRKVKAVVSGFYRLDPANFRLDLGAVWKVSERGRALSWVARVDPAESEALLELGVSLEPWRPGRRLRVPGRRADKMPGPATPAGA